MNQKAKKIVFALVAVLFMSPIGANALSLSAVDFQRDIVRAGAHQNSAEVDIEIEIAIPEYPEVEPLVFENHAVIPYTRCERSLSFDCTDLKPFYTELKDIPKSMKPITVGLDIEDSNIRASWNEKKEVTVSSVDVKVSLYKKRKWQIDKETKPAIEFVMSNVEISLTDYNMSEQWLTIDFEEILPKIGNEIFDEFLAGRKIEGSAIIDILNY